MAAASTFLPNIRVFLVLLAFAGNYPPAVTSAIGLGGSIAAVGMVLASGFVTSTVRTCAPLATKPTDSRALRSGIGGELSLALFGSTLFVIVGVAVAVLARLLGPADGYFVEYWTAALPLVGLSPVVFVITGAFQSLHRDRTNLISSLVGTTVQLGAALVVVWMHLPDTTAVVIIGATSSLAVMLGCVLRVVQLAGAGLVDGSVLHDALRTAFQQPRRSALGLVDRAAASIDGLVFMGVFTLAILVTSSSPPVSATVALAVSVMRGAIVPLKQFGTVGARFALRERGISRGMRLADVRSSTLLIVGIAAFAMLAARGFAPALQSLSWTLVVFMAAQLLTEPWGGVTYAFRKVTESSYRGLPALLLAYGAIAVPGLVVVAVLADSPAAVEPSAELVWGILLAARLVFVVAQSSGWRPRSAGAEAAASG